MTEDETGKNSKQVLCEAEEDDSNQPYAYIHIPPAKTGDKFQRLIVPVSAIKKFDYSDYVNNSNIYKEK